MIFASNFKTLYNMQLFFADLVMGRQYKRKLGNRNYKNYTEEDLQSAINLVKNGSGYRDAANQYGIPWKTLWNKVKGRHQMKAGGQTILSEVEERHFVDVLLAAAEFGSPLTSFDVRILVKRYLERMGRTVRKFRDNMPGGDWVLNFLDRHKHRLSQRSCQNIKRARAEKNEEEINEYFLNLRESIENVPPNNILNFDETNLSDDPGSTKCIFRRGMKYPERVLNTSKASISVMFAITGTGEVLPPYTVYKAERMYDQWTIGGPKNARYNRSKSGWFDSFSFEDWFTTIVVPWAKKTAGTKVIIGDNLSSHLNVNIIVECQRNNIRFVFLPKNATHLTQPLDVAYYGPLKRIWRNILLNYKIQNPRDQTLNKVSFPPLLKSLMQQLDLTNKKTIEGAFRGTGIIPLNPQEVLKRLPSTRAEQHVPENVSSSLLDYLKETRSPLTQKQPRQAKKALNIAPGKSVAFEDICPGSSLDSEIQEIENEYVDQTPIAEINGHLPQTINQNHDKHDVENEENEIPYPKVGSFVIIKLASKKSIKHFIGQIKEVQRPEIVVKYLRQKRDNIFVFPPQDDISQQTEDDIVEILKTPEIRRGLYTFQLDFKHFHF